MNFGKRRIRVVSTEGETRMADELRRQQSLDGIADPLRLAHALLGMGTTREEKGYQTSLRASSLAKVCVRERILGLRYASLRTESIGPADQLTFDIGKAVHFWLQNSRTYFGMKKMGWWLCMACGERFWSRTPSKCVRCGKSHGLRHEEHYMSVTVPWRLTGHMDLFLEADPGDVRVTDFKTVAVDEFKRLQAPRGDDVIQVTSYMMGLQYDPRIPVAINPRKGFLVYIAKQHVVGMFPMKAFHVHREPVHEAFIQKQLDEFTRAINDVEYLPPMIAQCRDTGWAGTKAKNCNLAAQCREMATVGTCN